MERIGRRSGLAAMALASGAALVAMMGPAPWPTEQPVVNESKKPRREKRRRSKARTTFGGYWGRIKTLQPYGQRECDRRKRQVAHLHQANSHKRGTVQPAHIFGVA